MRHPHPYVQGGIDARCDSALDIAARVVQQHFVVSHMDADCRKPASVGKIYRSALITRNGGWFGSAHRAPTMPPDPALWPAADFDSLVEAFRLTGFRPGNSWYLNDTANIAYAHAAPDGGRLRQPVLFVNGDFDGLCNITHNRLGDPMRCACQDLSVTNLPSGHWLPLERKAELTPAIRSWLKTKAL
jgi:pimeloyl-ACP methyl ester carboxylesterase